MDPTGLVRINAAGLDGVGVADIVRMNAYLTDAGDVAAFRSMHDRWAGGHAAAPEWKLEVEVVAAKGKGVSGDGRDKRRQLPREDPARARERFERRSAALRENLRRRKAQQQERHRPEGESDGGGEPDQRG